jgi:hypothetical protein
MTSQVAAELRARDLESLLDAVEKYVYELFRDLDVCEDKQEASALTRQLDVLGHFLIEYGRL